MTGHYYLSGPMRGYPAFNFPAFKEAADALRKRHLNIVSPAEKDEQVGFVTDGMTGNEDLGALGFDLHAALKWDMDMIATKDCIGVIVMDGWEKSSGCRAEVALALALGKPVLKFYLQGRYIDHADEFVWYGVTTPLAVTLTATAVVA